MRDVVVIGAGHNGLVAACYLAAAGLDVEVLEADTVLGGAVSTVERFPGYRVDRGSSAHIMFRHTPIAAELRLADCGLAYDDMEPWGFAPYDDGSGGQRALTFYRDLDRTAASIEAVCGGRDAEAYRQFVTTWTRRNERVFAAFSDRATPGRLGRAMWDVGGRGNGAGTARDFLGSADALLDKHFSHDGLKTALAWMGAQAGPPTHEPATADLVGWLAMLHRIPPGHPHGGSGALTAALGQRLRRSGGRVRLGDGVVAIDVRAGAAGGVRTRSGEAIETRSVIAACHILSTVDLLGPAVPDRLGRAIRTVDVGNGIGMAVRLGTTALPAYPSARPESYRAMQLLAPSRLALRAAYGDYLAGRPPRRPAVLAMSLSALDHTIAPEGRHNISLWGQWHPYDLADGMRWRDVAEPAADAMIAEVERLAPGFASTIEHVHIQDPAELERELRLPRGNVMHVQMSLASMFALRPVPELAGLRVPGVRALYLAGASMHPGGGVFGASGRSCARLLLADLRRPSWRSRRWFA